MNMPTLHRLLLRVELAWHRVSPVALGIGALLLASWVLWMGVLPAAQRQLADGHAELTWQKQVQQRRAQLKQPVEASASSFDNWRNTLGQHNAYQHDLRRVQELATSVGLELTQGEYKYTCDAGAQTCKYRMLFPVKGQYEQMRAWVQGILQTLPYAAVDTLTLKRETIAEEEVFATLGLTLYLQTPPKTGTLRNPGAAP